MEKDGIPCYRCETGDPYVCICSQGVRAEGTEITRYPSEVSAWESYRDRLAEYKEGKAGILYWRERPSVEFGEGRGYTIYSRLVISDKPEIAVKISGEYYWNQALCPQD